MRHPELREACLLPKVSIANVRKQELSVPMGSGQDPTCVSQAYWILWEKRAPGKFNPTYSWDIFHIYNYVDNLEIYNG